MVLEGRRPLRPSSFPSTSSGDILWTLFEGCWAADPESRPTLSTVHYTLERSRTQQLDDTPSITSSASKDHVAREASIAIPRAAASSVVPQSSAFTSHSDPNKTITHRSPQIDQSRSKPLPVSLSPPDTTPIPINPPPTIVAGTLASTLLGHSSSVYCVTFSPDNSQIASASEDRTIRIRDAVYGASLGVLPATDANEPDKALCVAYSSDGLHLYSCTQSGTLRQWDSLSNTLISSRKCSFPSAAFAVAFSPDFIFLVSRYWAEDMDIWDAQSGVWLRKLHGNTHVVGLTFPPDSSHLASGGYDQTIRLWNVQSGELVKTLDANSYVNRVAFSPDGLWIASGSMDSQVRIWDVASGECTFTMNGLTGGIHCLSFSLEGRWVASGSSDGTVRIWNAMTGAHSTTLTGCNAYVYTLAFSPDGNQLVTGFGSGNKTSTIGDIQLWNLSYYSLSPR